MPILTSLVTFLALLTPHAAHGNFITYIDENGTKHVVQSEDEVPEKFRKDVKKSAAGDSKNSFFLPDVPYTPNPKLSAKANCEKEAIYNFDTVRKKLFNKDEGALGTDEMKSYNELVARRESSKAACAGLSGTSAPEAKTAAPPATATGTAAPPAATPAPGTPATNIPKP